MRLATFEPTSGPPASGRGWRVGLLDPRVTHVIDAERALAWWRPTSGLEPPADPLAWYDLDAAWLPALARLHEALTIDETLLARLEHAGLILGLEGCRLGSPILRPGKIVCVGLNYRDHAAEARLPVPDSPVIFAKFASAVIGPDAPVVLPGSSRRVDFEAELAVVVGRRTKAVDVDAAMQAVLGYMNANDVTARDFQKLDGQWVRAKSCDTFAPLGPWLVTADHVPDPGGLRIQLRLNGTLMQDSSTREFVFDVGRLLAFLAETMTLEPGDIVLTGTPPGVGFARRPPVYLSPGDVIEVEIDGLGVLRNPVAGAG